MSTVELNIDYTLSGDDQENNRIGEALGLKDVYDINVTLEYTYRAAQPQTLYDPAWAEEIEVENYYVVGVYEDSTYVPISKEQSDMLLCLKPHIIDSLRLVDSIIDSRNDN